MEPTGTSPQMPWPQNLRPKQQEAIDWFKDHTELVLKFPTGYGKTRTAAGVFRLLRDRTVCNRILYVVTRRDQATQIADDLPDDLRLFGVETKSYIVREAQIPALEAHRTNSALLFIVTIQSLLTTKTWDTVLKLMQTGKWLVVIDEHHHYGELGEDIGAWTDKLTQLNYCAMLAMSATPNRHDGSDHFRDPDISETYKHASDAGYVKRLTLHAFHYEIDTVTIDGKEIKLTTEQLIEEVGSDKPDDIDRYLTRKHMSFNSKYIIPMVMVAVDRMVDLRTRGIKSQLIIQALSCKHAAAVAMQVEKSLPEHMSVDWVGTGIDGKTQEDNDKIMGQFCPPKDKITGKRPWTLDVLVKVGMCGETTDTMDVTEIVFLTSANITISNLQTIGRGARIIPRITGPQPECHVSVDTGSIMASYVGDKVMELFDSEETIHQPQPEHTHKCKECGRQWECRCFWPQATDRLCYDCANPYRELPEKLSSVVLDIRLLDIRSEPIFAAIYTEMRAKTDLLKTDEEIAIAVEEGIRNYMNRCNNQTEILVNKRIQIADACKTIVGEILKRRRLAGMTFHDSAPGQLKHQIRYKLSRKYGSIEDANESDMELMWQWLKALEKSVLKDRRLAGCESWVMECLNGKSKGYAA